MSNGGPTPRSIASTAAVASFLCCLALLPCLARGDGDHLGGDLATTTHGWSGGDEGIPVKYVALPSKEEYFENTAKLRVDSKSREYDDDDDDDEDDEDDDDDDDDGHKVPKSAAINNVVVIAGVTLGTLSVLLIVALCLASSWKRYRARKRLNSTNPPDEMRVVFSQLPSQPPPLPEGNDDDPPEPTASKPVNDPPPSYAEVMQHAV